MRRVDDDGKMGDATHGGNSRQVQCVASVLRKGADAAFAQYDLIIAFRHDVLSRKQPLVQRSRKPAFEQHGQMRLARAAQQRKVLHVARANLNHVAVSLNHVDAGFIQRLRNYLQTISLANIRQDFQTFLTETLKRIRRSPRLECATAEKARAAAAYGFRNRKCLRATFYCAWSSHDGQLIAANRRVAHADNRLFRANI